MPAPSGLPPRPPRTADDRFLNWAGTVSTRPSSWREPTSEDEVAGLVAEARERGGRVRVVGAGHSWSEVAAPNDVAVSLDRLAGLVSLDPERGLATVRAGTRLRDLNAALAARGYALPIVGSIAAQSLAGATATGTHGSSLVHGNLASLVRAMKLVDGRGELTTLAEPDPRLLGARVSLGALGVVTELTVRVEPAFQLLCTVERVPVSAAVRGLEAIARSAEYVKVWWLPHARHAYVYRYERTRLPSSPWPARVRWVEDHLVHAHVFPAVVALEGRAPRLVPAVNWLVGPTLTHGPRVAPSALPSSPRVDEVSSSARAGASNSLGRPPRASSSGEYRTSADCSRWMALGVSPDCSASEARAARSRATWARRSRWAASPAGCSSRRRRASSSVAVVTAGTPVGGSVPRWGALAQAPESDAARQRPRVVRSVSRMDVRHSSVAGRTVATVTSERSRSSFARGVGLPQRMPSRSRIPWTKVSGCGGQPGTSSDGEKRERKARSSSAESA